MIAGSFTWVKYILGVMCYVFIFRLKMEGRMTSKRICIHWTAGTHQPNGIEYLHYHYLVNSDGLIVKGKYEPRDNDNCKDGKYAQHCGGGNTETIGVALCGMAGFTGKPDSTKYPLTRKQCEAMFEFIAKLCKDYGIPVTPQTVYTHYEFGLAHPKTSSAGKIDIIYLHPFPDVDKNKIGNFIRSKIRWYSEKR